MKKLNTKPTIVILIMTHLSFGAPITYPNRPLRQSVSRKVFQALDIRLGTVSLAEINKKARVPGLRIQTQFGVGFDDLLQSSAQLMDNYYPGDTPRSERAGDGRPKAQLSSMQIAAVTNFPPRRVGIMSYFLTLGVGSIEGELTGTVVLRPLLPVRDGAKVTLLQENSASDSEPRLDLVDYADTFDKLDIRVGTVTSIAEKTIDFGSVLGSMTYTGNYPLFHEGLQVLRVFNLEELETADNFLGVISSEMELIPLTTERSMPNGRFLM